jgi:hypothetical protein
MGQSIQFRGVEAVVEAYRMNGVGPFAVWCGKIILYSSEDLDADDVDAGAAELLAWLKLMERGGTEGKYMLATYKLKDGEEIDTGTKIFRGFHFSLWTVDGAMQPYTRLKNDRLDELCDRMEALEQRHIDRALEIEEEDQGVMGKVGKVLNGLLDSPQIKDAIGAFLISKVMPMSKLGKVAGLDTASPAKQKTVLDEEQAAKAQAAINVLATQDPKLGDHLQGIAKIAVENPTQYNWLVSMLK